MSRSEFDEIAANFMVKDFHVVYMGRHYPVAAIDIAEDLIGIRDNKDDYEICYKRYENCTLL